MIEARALFQKYLKEFNYTEIDIDKIHDGHTANKVFDAIYNLQPACIVAAAIGNAKEEIVQELKEIQKTLKVIE